MHGVYNTVIPKAHSLEALHVETQLMHTVLAGPQ